MSSSLQRLNQIAKPDEFDDQKSASEIDGSESASTDFKDFNNALLSQIKRLIHGSSAGNWHDDPESIHGGDASLSALFGLAYNLVECLNTDVVGDFVYIRDDRVSEKWSVGKADPVDELKMPAIGVLIAKSASTTGVIQMIGPCKVFTGLDYTKPTYHLGSSGIQPELPAVGAGGYAMVQRIGKPVASDVLWLANDTRMIKRKS